MKLKNLLLNLIVMLCTPIYAASAVTLAWDVNPDPFVNGYVLYKGDYNPNQDITFTDSVDTGPVNTTSYYPTIVNHDYVFSVCAYYGVNADMSDHVESDFSNKGFFFPRWVGVQETMDLATVPFDWHTLRREVYDAAQWPFVRQHLEKHADGTVTISVELSADTVSWITLFTVPRSGEVVPVAFYRLEFP